MGRLRPGFSGFLASGSEHAAGRPRVEASRFEYGATVDPDPAEAGRIAMWRLVRREVLDGLRLDDHDVRGGAGTEHASVRETQPLGGLAGHLVDRRLPAQDAALPDVGPQDFREAPVLPGMRLPSVRLLGTGTEPE